MSVIRHRLTVPALVAGAAGVLAASAAGLTAAGDAGAAAGPTPSTALVHYGLPVMSAAQSRVGFHLPSLPTGTYQASVHVLAQVSEQGVNIGCTLDRPGAAGVTGYGSAFASSPARHLYYSSVDLSGVFRVTPGLQPTLTCFAEQRGATLRTARNTINGVDFLRITSPTNRVAR